MVVSIILMIIQIIPILYLLYWGWSNNKLTEYYIWIRHHICKTRRNL